MVKKELIKKIENREAKVAIIGLGYVGLPLAKELILKGFTVYGIEIDLSKVKMIQLNKSYVIDITDEDLKVMNNSGRFLVSPSYDVLRDADVIIIAVPTPLSKTRDPDISYILSSVNEIKRYLRKGQLIILESTTYPGTTDELVLPELESTNLKVGEDFFMAFSPERINPGDKVYTLSNTPKVVGGVEPNSTEVASKLYEKIVEKVVPVSSSKTAEMAKLLENTFRSVNIALVNEMAIACNILGIDIWEVIEASGTKPFGFMKFYPGPGIGGHCIPVDPHYLAWKLKAFNYTMRFIELASEINTQMPRYIVTRIQDILNSKGKPVKGAKILIMGLAYKRDVNDVRESPALDIVELLKGKGADVAYYDPYIEEIVIGNTKYKRIDYNVQELENYDLAVIVTDHSDVDYNLLLEANLTVFDTRNAMRNIKNQNVIKL